MSRFDIHIGRQIIVAPIEGDWSDGEVLMLSSLAPNSSTMYFLSSVVVIVFVTKSLFSFRFVVFSYAHTAATVTSAISDVVKSAKLLLDGKHVLALRCQVGRSSLTIAVFNAATTFTKRTNERTKQDKLIDFVGDVDAYDGKPFAVAGVADALRGIRNLTTLFDVGVSLKSVRLFIFRSK